MPSVLLQRETQHVKPKQRDLAIHARVHVGHQLVLVVQPAGLLLVDRADTAVRKNAAARYAGVGSRQRRIDIARRAIDAGRANSCKSRRRWCCRGSAVRLPIADWITYGARNSGLTVWTACALAICCRSPGRAGREKIRIVDRRIAAG